MKNKYFRSIFFSAILLSLSVLTMSAQVSAEADPAKEFYRMTNAAPAAFNAGEYERAIALSNQLLLDAEAWKENWNYGNAIHAANLVLGRVALARGEKESAGEFLLKAGRTPGSPQLKSFGPDMLFAKEMLRSGENRVVLEYFDLCANFWDKKHSSRLDEWRMAVTNKESPDFGANLRYFF